jgi:hypothetical protein
MLYSHLTISSFERQWCGHDNVYFKIVYTMTWNTYSCLIDIDTTFCDNISNTLIASGNENDTCTSGSEEVDITDNEHGNIFAHHVPYNDDIIVISSDCKSNSSVSFLKKKEMKR